MTGFDAESPSNGSRRWGRAAWKLNTQQYPKCTTHCTQDWKLHDDMLCQENEAGNSLEEADGGVFWWFMKASRDTMYAESLSNGSHQ